MWIPPLFGRTLEGHSHVLLTEVDINDDLKTSFLPELARILSDENHLFKKTAGQQLIQVIVIYGHLWSDGRSDDIDTKLLARGVRLGDCKRCVLVKEEAL